MNDTKIEWCDMTWNPVTGCLRGCEYCYARKQAHRFTGYDDHEADTKFIEKDGLFEVHKRINGVWKSGAVAPANFPFGFAPTLYRYRLNQPARKRKGKTIFVCSMADLFGPWVPTKWIVDVMDACLAAPQHRYLFLTKFPERYLKLEQVALLPHQENFWYGATATEPSMSLLDAKHLNTFASIEPMLKRFVRPERGALDSINWFILGAETGSRKGKVVPDRVWVQEVVDFCRETGKAVFMKDSLIPVMGEAGMVREFPWDVRKEGAWAAHLRNRFERAE